MTRGRPHKTICDCGKPTVAKHLGDWVCQHCLDCQLNGCFGGPLNLRSGVKPPPSDLRNANEPRQP